MILCPHCGAPLPPRPRSRMFITGSLFIAAGFILLLFLHLAVIVLASVVLVTIGASFVKGAMKATVFRCPACRSIRSE